MVENFITQEVNKDNFKEVFGKYLSEGDLLIDFADTVGTKDILAWCAENNIMYINTGEADWPDNWYSIFNENTLKREIINKYKKSNNTNKHPIILQHGNNPGLVSHFVKAGIEYIVNTQFKKDKNLKQLLKDNKFNEVALKLGIKIIHVNDIDLQETSDEDDENLYSTWCIDSFFFEMLSEATFNIGTHEKIDYKDECNLIDVDKGFLEFKNIAVDKKCKTYYPYGKFEGFLVPHEETITIAQNLEVKDGEKVIYRPSVMFIYSPCKAAINYLNHSKVNEYPNVDLNKPKDKEGLDIKEDTIIRGHIYPKRAEILYKEKIKAGCEYVGVLIMGEDFKPVWVGNRVEDTFLYKSKKDSYWQTPTITPVAMSALAAVSYMIKHKDKRGIYFQDDIIDYKYILKIAEKYISKTIYKTLDKEEFNIYTFNAKDFFVN